jgi:hypothetical protein
MEDAKLEELELQPVAFSDVLLLLLLVWFVLVRLKDSTLGDRGVA